MQSRFAYVLIPFEQGDVFRRCDKGFSDKESLNPFRAGRCLSTDEGEVVTFAQLMS